MQIGLVGVKALPNGTDFFEFLAERLKQIVEFHEPERARERPTWQ